MQECRVGIALRYVLVWFHSVYFYFTLFMGFPNIAFKQNGKVSFITEYTMASNPNCPFAHLWSKLGVHWGIIEDPKKLADSWDFPCILVYIRPF